MASRSSVELTERFNSPVTRQLLDYRKGAKGERARPRHRDFELLDIYEIASQVGDRMEVCDFVDTMVPKTYEAIWLALDDEDGARAYAIAAVDFGYELTTADRAASRNRDTLEAIVYTDDL